MGLMNVIRRLALHEKVAIWEIARRTCLSRNTIKKYLNAATIEPKFSIPERPSKPDPFADKLAGWLTCHSAHLAVRCYSTCSANSTSGPASS